MQGSGHEIGFEHTASDSRKRVRFVHRGYLCIVLIIFAVMRYLAVGLSLLDQPWLLPERMPRVAYSISLIDHEFAQFAADLSEIVGAIRDGKAVYPELQPEIDRSLSYIAQGGSPLAQPLYRQRPDQMQLLQQLAAFDNDLHSLLGADGEEIYLIVLQNSAEKRPNGGFFGSFGLIKIDAGRVTHLEIMDSYLPGYDKPGTAITGPSRLLNFLPEREIYFVGANKIGFTYHDGAHIKTLYEKSYPGQQVRGVLFVSTDMFARLLPGFQEQLWQWQFENAAIDLIRGQARWGKKELYLRSSNAYFQEHLSLILPALWRQLPDLIEERLINIYLTEISGPLHGWVRRNDLTTRFEVDHIYARDSNISFNKIDEFVDKIIQVRDEEGSLLIETEDEIVDISQLDAGEYTVSIIYTLHVPQRYAELIEQLATDYQIELTQRERHILSIDPERATRGVIYLPPSATIRSVHGDIYHSATFDTPFAHAGYYKSKMRGNNQINQVEIEIVLPE